MSGISLSQSSQESENSGGDDIVGGGGGGGGGGDDWESVPVKGKKGKGGSKVSGGEKKGAALPHNLPVAPGTPQAIALANAAAKIGQKGGSSGGGRGHFFGLWVGNVHSHLVNADELRSRNRPPLSSRVSERSFGMVESTLGFRVIARS